MNKSLIDFFFIFAYVCYILYIFFMVCNIGISIIYDINFDLFKSFVLRKVEIILLLTHFYYYY